jgi:hypothetical protein
MCHFQLCTVICLLLCSNHMFDRVHDTGKTKPSALHLSSPCTCPSCRRRTWCADCHHHKQYHLARAASRRPSVSPEFRLYKSWFPIGLTLVHAYQKRLRIFFFSDGLRRDNDHKWISKCSKPCLQPCIAVQRAILPQSMKHDGRLLSFSGMAS